VHGFVNYKKGCTRLAEASDKVYQLLAHGPWFSLVSSTTKTGRHDIVEILLKVTLNTKNQSINHMTLKKYKTNVPVTATILSKRLMLRGLTSLK
jgi:hypothetical protein